MPDAKWGEAPAALVTLKEGATASADELIAFARERLAHFKAPKRVEFGPLPKNLTGKVQKFALREAAWSGRDRQSGDGRRSSGCGPVVPLIGTDPLASVQAAIMLAT